MRDANAQAVPLCDTRQDGCAPLVLAPGHWCLDPAQSIAEAEGTARLLAVLGGEIQARVDGE